MNQEKPLLCVCFSSRYFHAVHLMTFSIYKLIRWYEVMFLPWHLFTEVNLFISLAYINDNMRFCEFFKILQASIYTHLIYMKYVVNTGLSEEQHLVRLLAANIKEYHQRHQDHHHHRHQDHHHQDHHHQH